MKLKASELKIGNIIQLDPTKDWYHKDDLTMIVESISKEGINFSVSPGGGIYWENLDDKVYIPLTEEWLLKFGFVVKELADYVKTDFTVYEKGKFVINDAFWVEFDDFDIRLEYKLEYVHQLQNLYFALTGEELIINQS
jgi:hypothetical protein